ncbi:MAG: hypothetical protein M1819_005574 [Sarea resinae]|nr:MAG: hypothetical protein M1819_005574 [Sarea resinae]
MTRPQLLLLAIAGCARAAYMDKRATSTSTTSSSPTTVPDYFQTTPEIFAGPTPTGVAPFLAQSNPAPFGSPVFVANAPLETAEPIVGNTNNASIFQLMANLSPYFPNPVGFGVDEYPLPAGANISQVQMLHRHGSRYPTSDSSVAKFGKRIAKAAGSLNATGALSFLNDWKFQLGAEILVPVGRGELLNSGILHYYQYGHLYNTSSKIIARTTTEDRMLHSAENFMAGFFGLGWTDNATLEVIIEADGFNNSLAGYDNCNNSNTYVSAGGSNATATWEAIYLANATARLGALVSGYNWTLTDTYAAQTLCPYETVALGYSAFCDLFTYAEWEGFEYSNDLSFYGSDSFGSPTGRAIGIGYVQEVLARLQNVLPAPINATSNNATLDNSTATFPLNQALYFDFSHDTNIMSILTAFGLTQFAQYLPPTRIVPRNLTVSHLEPFGARLDIEIIHAPHAVFSNRTATSSPVYDLSSPPTTYVHFVMNQRTIPLGWSLPPCGLRTDGWCEINAFIASQADSVALANFDYACNGDYPSRPPGNITNGAPLV